MNYLSDIKEHHLLERGFKWFENEKRRGYIKEDWFAFHLGYAFVNIYHPILCNNGEHKGVQFDSIKELDRVMNGTPLYSFDS